MTTRRQFDILEQRRLELQAELDAVKSQRERNQLGQFATPTSLARDILHHAISLLPRRQKIRFLDPAIGTGSFYSALRNSCPNGRVESALGFEIDRHYGAPATKLWQGSGLDIHLSDFTKQRPKPEFNLVVCNPPYVRHHHLTNEEKLRLQERSEALTGHRLGGLAGLYCHFLAQSHAWMAEDAVAVWLIPSEFMDVNYGRVVKQYLLEEVTLLQVHRFDPNDVQFADALVSSAVVCIQKASPPKDHAVRFTFGGSLAAPRIDKTVSAAVLTEETKWTRFPLSDARLCSGAPLIGDLFKIRRGLATGHNRFFILSEAEIANRGLPKRLFRPILPSPRYVPVDVIEPDADGVPLLDRRLFLLDTRLPEDVIQQKHPQLWEYLEEGIAEGIADRYLCRHRSPWYVQEDRPPAPIVCTYLGRGDARSGRPFRFIRNKTSATVANVYLAMYPTARLAGIMKINSGVIEEIWKALNQTDPAAMLGEGRVYGGGLHKLEPRELANVPVPGLADITDHFGDEELLSSSRVEPKLSRTHAKAL